MENKKTAVFGIYTTVAAADLATDSLVKAGFSAADVSALLPENLGSKPIATEKELQGSGRRCDGRRLRGSSRRDAGIACRHRRSRNSGRRTTHRRGTDHGSSRGRRSRWCGGRIHRRFNRNGDTRVRSETLRRTFEEGWHSSFRALRYLGRDQASQGNHEEYSCGRCLIHRGSFCRWQGDGPRRCFKNSRHNALITLTEGRNVSCRGFLPIYVTTNISLVR